MHNFYFPTTITLLILFISDTPTLILGQSQEIYLSPGLSTAPFTLVSACVPTLPITYLKDVLTTSGGNRRKEIRKVYINVEFNVTEEYLQYALTINGNCNAAGNGGDCGSAAEASIASNNGGLATFHLGSSSDPPADDANAVKTPEGCQCKCPNCVQNAVTASSNMGNGLPTNYDFTNEAQQMERLHRRLLENKILKGTWDRLVKVSEFFGNEESFWPILETASYVSIKFLVFTNSTDSSITPVVKAEFSERKPAFLLNKIDLIKETSVTKAWRFRPCDEEWCKAIQRSEVVVLPMRTAPFWIDFLKTSSCSHLLWDLRVLNPPPNPNSQSSDRDLDLTTNLDPNRMPNLIASILLCH